MTLINRGRKNDVTFIPVDFVQNQQIGAAAKLVYMSIASRRQQGEPDPGVDIIIAETGLTAAQVQEGEEELNALSDEDWDGMQL